MEHIIYWATTPDHEACPVVLDIYNVTPLEKTDFPFPNRSNKNQFSC